MNLIVAFVLSVFFYYPFVLDDYFVIIPIIASLHLGYSEKKNKILILLLIVLTIIQIKYIIIIPVWYLIGYNFKWLTS